MRNSDDRAVSFGDVWTHPISPREMADAGFFYYGSEDRMVCFYCGGGLKNWETDDNPWHEHAKWFPLCEYLLKKQGVSYVRNICLKYPKMDRPEIVNPSQAKAAKSIRDLLNGVKIIDPCAEERKKREIEVEVLMLTDPHVKYAKRIGIDKRKIKDVLLQQLEKKQKFTSREELLNAILDQEPDAESLEKRKCKKCNKEERNALCMPCGHLLLCWKCVQEVEHCWGCNKLLKEKIRIYH